MVGRGGRTGRAAASAAAMALASGGARRASSADWRLWLAGCLQQEVEQRRLFPWIAVAFGLGILLVFAAEGRPALWAPLAGASCAVGVAVLVRRRLEAFAAAIAISALFLGFAAGVMRMRAAEAPVLGRTTIAPLTGFIESLEEREAGARMVVQVHEFAALPL